MKRNSEKVSVLFLLFSIFFCVCLIAANLLGTKQIAVGSVSLTGGLIVFPISYIINDCVCEVWGYKKTRMLIWVGFIMNFFFVMMGALCDWIPGAPTGQTMRDFMPSSGWRHVSPLLRSLLSLVAVLSMRMS